MTGPSPIATMTRLSKRLKTLFGKRKEVTRLDRLPVELLILILDCLPWTDAACLMLTCKRIYNHTGYFSHCLRHIDQDGGLDDLVIRMEKNLSTKYFYCANKQRLVRIRPRHRTIYENAGLHFCDSSDSKRMTQFQRATRISFQYSENTYVIAWCTARMVTNSYFWGVGAKPSILSSTFKKSFRDVDLVEHWEARLAAGELLLSCSRECRTELEGSVLALHNFCYESSSSSRQRASVCKHISRGLPSTWVDWEPFAVEGSCMKCCTDWTASFVACRTACKECKECEWSLTVNTYHNLGDFRAANHKWDDLAFCSPVKSRTCGAGSVRRLWAQHQ